MSLTMGAQVWIDCEVTPGPFGDERTVYVEVGTAKWTGYVNVRALADQVSSGHTRVQAQIVKTNGTTVELAPRGSSIGNRVITAPKSAVHQRSK